MVQKQHVQNFAHFFWTTLYRLITKFDHLHFNQSIDQSKMLSFNFRRKHRTSWQ